MIELLPERIRQQIVISNDSFCWEWTGPKDRGGYGHTSANGVASTAHRVIYGLLVEPIERGMDADHLCKNRSCVNPVHVEPVTHAENVRRQEQSRRLRCIRGHLLEPAPRRQSRRFCRTCKREQENEAARKKREAKS